MNVIDSNTNYRNVIQHSGRVSEISENSIRVTLTDDVHCDSCKVKNTCGISGKHAKEVEIYDPRQNFQLHETVNVIMQKGLGFKAVFWAYLFPFILLFVVLLAGLAFFSEWLAGLLAILILIPYYLFLYFMNTTFKNTFKITLLKNI